MDLKEMDSNDSSWVYSAQNSKAVIIIEPSRNRDKPRGITPLRKPNHR